MSTLHLGVTDLAYADPDAKGAKTTWEVAEILEEKYHVMWVFQELNKAFIQDALTNALAGEIESIAQGRPPSKNPMATADQEIQEKFQDFLDSRTYESTFAITLAAAQAGVSHRKKNPHDKKNKSRPAFIDTGLYQAAFRAWMSHGNN